MSYQTHPGIRASFIVFLFFVLVLVLIFVSLNIFGTAFRKLGFPPEYSVYFLFLSLLGSNVNFPVKVEKTSIAVNLGGAVIPIVMSGFLSTMVSPVDVIIGVLIMTFFIHSIARPVVGRGIAIHVLIPPFLAAATALMISPQDAPMIAYISGTIGCLIGVDLLNLKKIADLDVPVISIGGAGTFDAIFLTGLISVLLA
ncbi:MAG: DUF1614 domain-containing protein [Candidatus Methanoperedens sp.]|nr:DUF1614 domain-containing protein [Candidatus Methanoperedens sp.]